MLSIYISADLEGTNGVIYPHQTVEVGGESYFSAVEQQHKELNCIVEALLELQADKITVNDAHGSMENLNLAELNPNIHLITGKPKPVSMMAGLDETYSCVIFSGYHAQAGSKDGVLAHTISSIFKRVRLNGNFVGETELNALYAGLKNVPVIMLTGDNIACNEALSVIKNITTVCTKTAVTYTSAICKPNEELFKELKAAVITAIKNKENWTLCQKDSPYILEVDLRII
jgi:D-amino peptidase